MQPPRSNGRILPFWLSLLMPAVAAVGLGLGGIWIAATPFLLFVLIPIVDEIVGLDTDNPVLAPRSSRLADAALYAWVPAQVALVTALCLRVGTGEWSGAELFGLAVSVGLTTGAGGINVAHELMHRASRRAHAASETLMTTVLYPHFCVEHVHGHHRHVATPADPASARHGESLFAFWPRTLVGGLRGAWAIETRRIRSGRGGPLLLDRRVRFPLMVAAALGLALWLGGGLGLAMFVGQAAVAVLLLETINYIEHYGLRRRETAPGQYERVRPQHSWNASHRITNWFLFNLQRHSDHHYLASRPYWRLRHYDDVPQLPFSYPTAFLAALVPPLWRHVMDPRVDAWNLRARHDEVAG